MLATEQTQSLTDFRQKATETLDRLNRTGQAEIITVNGQARAVLLSPAAYDALAREAEISRDVEMIKRSQREFDQGLGRGAGEFFDELHARLLKMKRQKARKTAKRK